MSEEQQTKITEDEKIEFFKCFLADKPYSQKESLFDNKFEVAFRSLTVEESTDVFEQLRKDQIAGRLTNDATYGLWLTNYRLALGITHINKEAFLPNITKDKYKPTGDDDSYIKAKAALFNTWNVFKLSAVADSFKVFEDKIIQLTKEISNPAFWKAAQ
jgi:hypothetical protein